MANFWEELHKKYDGLDWIEKPSIFAEEVTAFLPDSGTLLDLGAGQGQDSIYFAEGGFEVISTDVEASALERGKARALDKGVQVAKFEQLDVSNPLPYADSSFDVVYSHLALHYFDAKTTSQIFDEIFRVLKPGGIIAFLCNSVNDPEYNTGTKIEDDYFDTAGTKKRYFSEASAREFGKSFEVIVCDEKGETYKDKAKGVHNLVRFVGRKP